MKTYSQRQIGEVINGLEIQTILRSERGQPVYGCLCRECGAKGVPVHHEQFNTGSARCISSLHGRTRYQPTTIKKIKAEEAAEYQRKEEEAVRPVREAEASLNETHRKLYELEKAEIETGRPDQAWAWPQSAVGLNMSVGAAREFAKREGEAFVAANPSYFPSKKNFETIVNYLSAQGVVIPTRDCFAQAVERLQHFGLLEERPAPSPEPTPVAQAQPIEETEAPPSDLVDGWDIETGQPRKYSEREINRMSSDEFKKAFKMWVTRDEDRRPKFNRSRYQ